MSLETDDSLLSLSLVPGLWGHRRILRTIQRRARAETRLTVVWRNDARPASSVRSRFADRAGRAGTRPPAGSRARRGHWIQRVHLPPTARVPLRPARLRSAAPCVDLC